MDFLDALLKVSEKAANVARIIRQEDHLFKLLVQQKDVTEANPRFVEDFKTLADVLIQEMVKHDLGTEFPGIKDKIFGEESNVFCNKLGEEIIVEIKDDLLDTAELLENVLNGDKEAAISLAEEVHKSISLEEINTSVRCDKEFSLDIDKIGIWIDPIDSTGEYINAKSGHQEDISTSGLNCVTILIGAFNIDNGEPLVGVINQPFSQFQDSRWIGECFWGVSTPKTSISSIETSTKTKTNKACLSSLEDKTVKIKLRSLGFDLIEAAGAGYKILTVIKGIADFYILSKSSTYKWDTCGPQAILKSIGGEVVNYEESLKNKDVTYPIRYTITSGRSGEEDDSMMSTRNSGGLIAFRDRKIMEEVIKNL